MTAEAVLDPVDIKDPFSHLRWDASAPNSFVLMTPRERAEAQLRSLNTDDGLTIASEPEIPKVFSKTRQWGGLRITDIVGLRAGCIAAGVAVVAVALSTIKTRRR